MVWYVYLACCIVVSVLFLIVKRFKPGCSFSLVAFLIAAILLFIGERCIGYNPSWYIVASGMVALAVLMGGWQKDAKGEYATAARMPHQYHPAYYFLPFRVLYI